jgi:hypothetical protein
MKVYRSKFVLRVNCIPFLTTVWNHIPQRIEVHKNLSNYIEFASIKFESDESLDDRLVSFEEDGLCLELLTINMSMDKYEHIVRFLYCDLLALVQHYETDLCSTIISSTKLAFELHGLPKLFEEVHTEWCCSKYAISCIPELPVVESLI